MKCILDNKIILNKGLFNNIDVIENTKGSIEEAFKNNYVVRCKLQFLKDGEFILFDDEALEQLFNLKDSIKNFSYDDLSYISTFEILRLNDLLEFIDDNIVILDTSNLSKKLLKRLIKKIINYQNNFVIENNNFKYLKLFKKYNFNISILIDNRNNRYLNKFLKTDFYNVEIGLFDNKFIKRLREDYYVLGSVVKDEKTLKNVKNIYDNLVLENKQ